MIAPTRSGKGVSTVIPTCLNYGIPYYATEKNKDTGKYEQVIKGRGSMVIFDPKESFKIDEFTSKSQNSPFKGVELKGKIKYTICNGRIVYSDGKN